MDHHDDRLDDDEMGMAEWIAKLEAATPDAAELLARIGEYDMTEVLAAIEKQLDP